MKSSKLPNAISAIFPLTIAEASGFAIISVVADPLPLQNKNANITIVRDRNNTLAVKNMLELSIFFNFLKTWFFIKISKKVNKVPNKNAHNHNIIAALLSKI